MIGKEIKWRSDLRRDVNPLRVALFRRWNVPEESLRTRDLSWNTSEDSRFRDDDLGKFTGMILLVLSQLLVLDKEVYAILNYFVFDVTFLVIVAFFLVIRDGLCTYYCILSVCEREKKKKMDRGRQSDESKGKYVGLWWIATMEFMSLYAYIYTNKKYFFKSYLGEIYYMVRQCIITNARART